MTVSNEGRQDSGGVDYVSAIMHELKTSLTAIIASAEIIADELHLDEGSVHWKLVQSIIRNAHRLNERVTAFAQIPRPPVETFEFRPEPVDIGQIIRNVVTRVHPGIQSRRQSLGLDVPDSLPVVRADKQHLEEVLLCQVDLGLIDEARNNLALFFRDRRIDSYGGLTERFLV